MNKERNEEEAAVGIIHNILKLNLLASSFHRWSIASNVCLSVFTRFKTIIWKQNSFKSLRILMLVLKIETVYKSNLFEKEDRFHIVSFRK